MSGLVASATGTLERTPLTHLLIYTLDRELTGTIVLEAPDGVRHAIFMQRGVPSKIRTGNGVALLGKILVEMSATTTANVEDALVASQTLGCPLGAALIDAGKLDEAKLLDALKRQMTRKLISLFALPPSSVFGFYDQHNLLEKWGGPELVSVDVLAVLHAGISTSPEPARIDAALRALGDAPLKLHIDGDFKRFGLSDRGRGIVDLLKMKPMSLPQLLNSGVASETVTRQVIYTFLITRHLDLGQNAKPPVGTEARPAAPSVNTSRAAVGRAKLKNLSPRSTTGSDPPAEGPASVPPVSNPSPLAGIVLSLTPEQEARRKEIIERAEVIDKEDFFTMLGVPQDATNDVVQSAYFSLVKRWHPDRLPSELGVVREQAAKVFSRLSEAFQTLTDKERRAKYIELMKQGGGSPEEQEKVNQILEAQIEFQKAEILLKKGDIAGAERFASQAAAKDPEQHDYIALLAWLKATRPGSEPDTVARSIKMLDGVLGQVPNHLRSLWYRGSLLKRIGKANTAVADFKKLLELDPKHIDAIREVRLHEMRQGNAPAAESVRPPPEKKEGDSKEKKSVSDIFGKLFKKS